MSSKNLLTPFVIKSYSSKIYLVLLPLALLLFSCNPTGSKDGEWYNDGITFTFYSGFNADGTNLGSTTLSKGYYKCGGITVTDPWELDFVASSALPVGSIQVENKNVGISGDNIGPDKMIYTAGTLQNPNKSTGDIPTTSRKAVKSFIGLTSGLTHFTIFIFRERCVKTEF